jgi:hypothetical protein
MLRMKKHLLVTFDYELYLGKRSGSVADCMIEPTSRMIAAMKPYGIRSIFFVDTTYLMRLKEHAAEHSACRDDFRMISDQLIQLVDEGHYVFPHVHPHWIDAEYVSSTNQWQLENTRKYRFHDIGAQEKTLVFDGSVSLLSEIIHTKHPEYPIDSYRAGGWCIQPFSDFQPFFNRNNIRYEFSVLPGFYQFSDAQQFDFTLAPNKNIYRFGDDVCLEKPDGPFTQFTISSVQVPVIYKLSEKVFLKLLYKVTGDHTLGKGQGQPSKDLVNKTPAAGGGYNITDSDWERVSIELLNSVKLPLYLQFAERNDYMHFISHPKMITRHNQRVFSRFLEKLFSRHEVETDFRKMIS